MRTRTAGEAEGAGATGVARGADVQVQFSEPMMFRVIRVHDWQTYDGWAWLDGYQLNSAGDAVERRSIYVQLQGL